MHKTNEELITHFACGCVVKKYILKIYKDLPATTYNVYRKELTVVMHKIMVNNLRDREQLIKYAVEAEEIFQKFLSTKSFATPLK